MRFTVGDHVEIVGTKSDIREFIGKKGEIIAVNEKCKEYLTDLSDCVWFTDNELRLIKKSFSLNKINQKTKSFKEIANEIGEFTDMKNDAYGSSVDATYEVMKVLLNKYKNDDNTYTIPESLLKHMLLQVRILDKINRIFNNPDGDKLNESPYRDLVGYGLIGVRETEK